MLGRMYVTFLLLLSIYANICRFGACERSLVPEWAFYRVLGI